jgi:hypothetical protein
MNVQVGLGDERWDYSAVARDADRNLSHSGYFDWRAKVFYLCMSERKKALQTECDYK